MTVKNKLPLNAVLFLAFILVVGMFTYVVEDHDVDSLVKPWHTQMNKFGDELSFSYVERYKVLDYGRTISQLDSFEGTTVSILVDAWGVPYEENKMAEEFGLFEGVNCEGFLHKRLLNYTKHAEHAEFRLETPGGIYLFNGDSAEYGRRDYVKKLGYEQILFCHRAEGTVLLEKVDSLLKMESRPRIIAVSLQSSRQGNQISIRKSLEEISRFCSRWNDVRFIIQGTHRPVLVSREERERYYAYWVPVVVVTPKNHKGNVE